LLGGFFPHPIPQTDRLLFSSFGEGRYQLYTTDLLEPFEVFAAVDEDLPEEEIERIEAEFAAASSVELSEDNVTRSASGGWHIEDIQIAGGVTSRGTILSNTAIVASDLLGNHRITAILGSVESQRNYSAAYTNLKTRLNWGIYGTSQRSYFLFIDPINSEIDRQSVYALDGGEIFAEYPLSRDTRLEFSVGYFRREYNLGGFLQSTGGQTANLAEQYTNGKYMPIGFGIITDKARFKEYGAFSGSRVALNTSVAPPGVGDLGFYDVSLDLRKYLQITGESQLALRLWGSASFGDDPSVFFFGGLNQLRGYNFLQFSGNRAFFANLEYRFPVIYEAALGSLAIRHIRGTLFLDVGAGWFDEEDFTFWQDGRLQDARASFGIGIGFFLGPVPLNWYLSQRTDFDEFFGDPSISFYLGPNF
jgi:outer membrane protein assembly factor BamA